MLMVQRALLALLTAGLLCGAAVNSARSQFEEMARHIPPHANVLVMVNAEKVFASEVAKAEGWEAQRGKRFESGLTAIPAKATRIAVGSQVDLETMRPLWDAAIIAFPKAPSLADISEYFGGVDDKFGTTPALRVADDSYLVRFSDQLIGAFGPGNRQFVSSWLGQDEIALSPYLRQALKYEEGGTEVILAIDASHALTPALVQDRLEESEDAAIKNAKVPVEKIAEMLSSLRGGMLGITFGKQPYAKLRFDFEQDMTSLSDIAGALVLGSLANHGALIEEMEEWKVQVKGKTIFLDGYLEESGLMRIATLINLPTHALHAPATSTADAPDQSPSDPEQLVLETTQQYFKSVERILRDLRGRKGEARTIGTFGVWFNNYANKIDRLPILNVDEQMLQYGQYVAQQLRDASMVIKGHGIAKSVAEVEARDSAQPFAGYGSQYSGYAGAYYGGAGYGAYGRPVGNVAYGWAPRAGAVASNTAYVAGRMQTRQSMQNQAAARMELKAQAGAQVQMIIEQLRETHSQMRVAMTQKYQVEF